jgi:hypothetical protein
MTAPSTRPAVVPFVFVLSGLSAAQLESLRALQVKDARPHLTSGVFIWCLQTFLELKGRGLPVALMSEPRAGSVNFVHVRQLYRRRPAAGIFIVSVQADYAAIPWTSVNVVQNRLQADVHRSHWIPHWPQPGLIPRSQGRNRVKCVAYAGNPRNLAGSASAWGAALKSQGIEFRHLDSDNWNDYSGVDVLLAVRSFDKARHENKPPSKLLNAWHAGIPLVAGYDSAFEQVGQPGHDYLRVRTLNEAIDAICLLRDDSYRYSSIVAAGAARASGYTRDRICDAWENLLLGPIACSYQWWNESRLLSAVREQLRFRSWRFLRFFRSNQMGFRH